MIWRADTFSQRQLHATVTTMIARIDSSVFISALSAPSAVIRLWDGCHVRNCTLLLGSFPAVSRCLHWCILNVAPLHRAPFHCTMTHSGIAETKVVMRLWIMSLVLALVGLLSLMVR